VVNYKRVFDYVNKLAYRSHAKVFIGYGEGAKAYYILDPTTRRVCTVHDVMFLK
jgi:hypothetical protein